MLSRKIIFSWIACTFLMFFLSYTWHGIVLNDFKKISYQKEIFFSFLFLLYVITGFLITISYSMLDNKRNPVMRGFFVGAVTGFIIFLVVFVLGTSFTGRIQPAHITLDFVWQLLEQGSGGMMVGYIFYCFRQREILFD